MMRDLFMRENWLRCVVERFMLFFPLFVKCVGSSKSFMRYSQAIGRKNISKDVDVAASTDLCCTLTVMLLKT